MFVAEYVNGLMTLLFTKVVDNPAPYQRLLDDVAVNWTNHALRFTNLVSQCTR